MRAGLIRVCTPGNGGDTAVLPPPAGTPHSSGWEAGHVHSDHSPLEKPVLPLR